MENFHDYESFREDDISMLLQNNLLDILRHSEVGSTNWSLANTILTYGSRLSTTSIQELADECHVSESTVSRFARLLGCRSYIDLKNQAKSLQNESDRFLFHMTKDSINKLANQPSEFMTNYTETISNNLTESVQSLDYKKIDQFILDLFSAQRVFIFGTSTSLMLAEIIQSNLSHFQKIVYVSFDQKQQENHIDNLNPSDLVIVISTFGHYFHEYPELTRKLTNSEYHTVLLTQNTGLQEILLFDEVILFSKENHPETGTYSMLLGVEYLVRRYAVLARLNPSMPN